MKTTFWTAFGTSLLAAFVTSTGIYVIGRFKKWGHQNPIHFICFAAGSLVYEGASHLLLQSETEHRKFGLIVLGTGILVAFVIIFPKQ